ncbi:MAG: aldo/keto reductase [Gemmatimonadota bacterium]|nr:aldo/keto reductase [Gemmatimonadota bacterium]
MRTNDDGFPGDERGITRRTLVKKGVGAGLAVAFNPLAAWFHNAAQASVLTRAIPSSGERIPVIGIGTARRYESAASPEDRAPLREVLRRLPELGGKLIDTAPAYGIAETVVGDLVSEIGNRDKLFLATKVGVRNGDRAAIIAQMEASLQHLKTNRIDLMQIWNLIAVPETLPILREWKAAGRIRYIGITTSNERQYEPLLKIMASEKLDFIQVDYAVDGREAEARILPTAKDKGIAVLTNLPFGRSRVFEKVSGKPVPDWAREIDCTTWAQIFLKYIVSNDAVTCAIPGTAKLAYLEDNQSAARGKMPDAAMRTRIEAAVSAA